MGARPSFAGLTPQRALAMTKDVLPLLSAIYVGPHASRADHVTRLLVKRARLVPGTAADV